MIQSLVSMQVHLAERLASPCDKTPVACSWTAKEVPSQPWLEYVPGRDTLIQADQLAAGADFPSNQAHL